MTSHFFLKSIKTTDIVVLATVGFTPLYLWSSGLPQIAHIFLIILIPLLFIIKNVKLLFEIHEQFLIALLILAFFREVATVAFDGISVGMIEVAYLAFNIAVLFAIRNYLQNDDALKIFHIGFSFALILATLGLFVGGVHFTGDSVIERAIGTFNNPNQLGYFSVCAFSLLVILHKVGIISQLYAIIYLSFIGLLSIASLSKGANLSLSAGVILFLLSIFTSQRIYFTKFIFLLGLVAIAFAISTEFLSLDDYLITHRLNSIGVDSDDSFSERGTFALFDSNPGIFGYLFGIGYFESYSIVGHEIHSTFAVNLVNYGFVGGGLYFSFLIFWFIKCLKFYGLFTGLAIVLPPLIYGVAHNGTRFLILYLTIALSLSNTVRNIRKSV